jgi:hypothetical protein
MPLTDFMELDKKPFYQNYPGCMGLIAVGIFLLLIRFLFAPLLSHNWNYFKPAPVCHPLNDSIEAADPIGNSDYQRSVMIIMERSSPDDFRYYFKDTIGSDEKYMKVNVRNDTICFTVKMNTDSKEKIVGMLATNARGYPREMYGLQWKIQSIKGKRELVYLTMHDIID